MGVFNPPAPHKKHTRTLCSSGGLFQTGTTSKRYSCLNVLLSKWWSGSSLSNTSYLFGSPIIYYPTLSCQCAPNSRVSAQVDGTGCPMRQKDLFRFQSMELQIKCRQKASETKHLLAKFCVAHVTYSSSCFSAEKCCLYKCLSNTSLKLMRVLNPCLGFFMQNHPSSIHLTFLHLSTCQHLQRGLT